MVSENKKTEDTHKLTLLAFKIIAILHNTRLATFIKLLKTVSKSLLAFHSRTVVTRSWIAAAAASAVMRSIPKEDFADSFQKLYERCQPCVVKNGDYFEGQ
jgi:hypothetical protein